MSKVLSVFICVLIIALFAGCSGAGNNSATQSDSPIVGTVTPGTIGPYSVDSIEVYHNFLLAARAYAIDGIMTYDMTDSYGSSLNNALRNRNFGHMERYYIPSWLPEELTISHINFHNEVVSFQFDSDGFITFTWWLGANAKNHLNERIELFGLRPVVGIEGLYYYDHFPSVRSYHWIQDGYMFRLEIPLRVIEEHSHPNDGFGRADEAPVGDSIAALVMGSALAVELVDGERYVPPRGIEIIAPAEDIAVGETLALTARVLPGNATIDAVFWNSSNNNNATVTQNGVVTRVGMGTATITARTVGGNLAATFVLGRAS